MASAQPFEVEPPAVTVAFSCPFIQPAELLQLRFVLFFERFNLRVCADEVVRRGEVRVLDVRDLPPSTRRSDWERSGWLSISFSFRSRTTSVPPTAAIETTGMTTTIAYRRIPC
jgi:hypothetical protein